VGTDGNASNHELACNASVTDSELLGDLVDGEGVLDIKLLEPTVVDTWVGKEKSGISQPPSHRGVRDAETASQAGYCRFGGTKRLSKLSRRSGADPLRCSPPDARPCHGLGHTRPADLEELCDRTLRPAFVDVEPSESLFIQIVAATPRSHWPRLAAPIACHHCASLFSAKIQVPIICIQRFHWWRLISEFVPVEEASEPMSLAVVANDRVRGISVD